MTLDDFRDHLVIIEDLEGVVEDGLNHSDLPTGVGDVATRVGTHQGWSIMMLAVLNLMGVVFVTYPKQMARLPAFMRFAV